MKPTQKIICVLNPDDKYYIEHNLRDNSQTKGWVDAIVTPIEIEELRKEGFEFPDINVENRVYCIDPLKPKRYISRTQGTDEQTIEIRIKTLEQILQLLGGKNFRVTKELSCRTEQRKGVKAGVDGSYEGYVAGAGVESSKGTDNEVAAKGEGHSEWEGLYTLRGYNEAVQIAKETGLDQDPIISSFLDKRNPKNINILKKETYSYSACSDLKENCELCASIKGGVQSLLSIDVSVDTTCNSSVKNNEIFEYEVEFGKFVGPKRKWVIPMIVAMLIAGGIAIGLFIL